MAGIPNWIDYYNKFAREHEAKYAWGIDRPWTADADAMRSKQAIDDAYLAALADYNAANGTNITPDTARLGTAQTTDYTPKPQEGGGFLGKLSGLVSKYTPSGAIFGEGKSFLDYADKLAANTDPSQLLTAGIGKVIGGDFEDQYTSENARMNAAHAVGLAAAGGSASGMFSGSATGAEAGTGMMGGADIGAGISASELAAAQAAEAAAIAGNMGGGMTAAEIAAAAEAGAAGTYGATAAGTGGLTALQTMQLAKAGLSAVSQLAGGSAAYGGLMGGNYGAGNVDSQLRPQAMAIPAYMKQPNIRQRESVDPYMEYLTRQKQGYFGNGGILA